MPVPTTITTVTERHIKNIEYFDGRCLDLFLPAEGSGPFPTVLVFHADGGTRGVYTWLGEDLAAAGYAVVMPNWSPIGLMADNGLCALGWVHANAKTHSLDPQRIAAFGHSAGGTLAALIAAIDDPGEFLQACPYDLPDPTALKGVVSYAAGFGTQEWYLAAGKDLFAGLALRFNVSQEEGEKVRQALLDTPYERWLTLDAFDDAGTRLIHTLPSGWIDGSEPPFLLIYGSDDTFMSPAEVEASAKQLEAAGVEAQVVLIEGATHDFLGPLMPGFDEIWDAMLAFLAQVLK